MKYANIVLEKKTQPEGNLGDYVQLIAIDDIYHDMGVNTDEVVRIEYYDLADYDGEDVILPINFFWFNPSKAEGDYIPSQKIHPVYLGLHLNGDVSETMARHIRNNLPIGCRDESTLNRFLSSQYLSDCEKGAFYLQGDITMTFRKRPDGDYKTTYLVDIPKHVEEKIPPEIKEGSVRLSQLLYDELRARVSDSHASSIQEYVRERLKLYKETAKMVITSRMHCAVPCIAMGIPVVFIVPAMSSRFSWMEKITHIYTWDEIDRIDWNPIVAGNEDIKGLVRQNAINMIRGEQDKSLQNKIQGYYLDREKRKWEENGGLGLLRRYADIHWKKEDSFNYLMWGVTATTDEVYLWMKGNFPNAKLVTVIDEFRDIDYQGIRCEQSSVLTKYEDCYYIGTGASASKAMKERLNVLGEKWVERGIPLIP